MRIIIAHNYINQSFAGNTWHLAKELVAQGHQVLFFSHQPAFPIQSTLDNEAIQIVGWPEIRPTGFKSFFYYLKLHRKFRPDMVIAHFSPQNIIGIVSFLLRCPRRIVYYHTTSPQIDIDSRHSKIKLSLLRLRKRLVFALYKQVVCPSFFAVQDLKKAFGVSETKMLQAYYGIEKEIIPVSHPPSPVVFGFLGRLSPTKGALELIEGFKLFKQQHNPNARLIIAGSGVLKNQVQEESDANPDIDWIGALPYEQVKPYLASLHYFVCPSLVDNSPTTCIESLLAGTPIVAAPVGGIPESFDDGKEGFYFSDHSKESIALALWKAYTLVANESDAYEAMRRQALARFDRQFWVEKTTPLLITKLAIQ